MGMTSALASEEARAMCAAVYSFILMLVVFYVSRFLEVVPWYSILG